MRRTVLLALGLVVGLATTAVGTSAVPAERRLIVPGVRIGPWTLASGIAGLKSALGAPAAAAVRPMFDQQPGVIGYTWPLPDGVLTAWSRDGRTIGYLEVRGVRTYRTAKLIGVGSTNLELQAAYGTVPARSAIPGASRYIYDSLGFAVFTQGTSKGFIAVAVDVFRPGSAAQFWKF